MATVTSPFLAAVNACTWHDSGGGCLITTGGVTVVPTVAASAGHTNAWGLAASGPNGHAIPHAVFVAMVGATANSDGTFTTASGVSYWLGVNGSGVCDLPSAGGPPPPP